MVIDEALDEEMKVTVIATGFRYAGELPDAQVQPFPLGNRPGAVPASPTPRYATPGSGVVRPVAGETKREDPAEIPFYRKAIAQGSKGDDPGGFGPNWSNVDDYDIPTVLRKQMD